MNNKTMVPTEPQKLIDYEKRLFEYAGEDRMISSHELAELLKQTDDSIFTQKTGIGTLDRLLNGVEAGELIVVSGPSGHGKTTFMMSITKNMAKTNVLTAWFTLEVTPRQFIKKMLAREGILPLFYTPAKHNEANIRWLLDRIVESKLKYNTDVIFIDHLHRIFSLDKVRGINLSLEIGDIVSTIKQIALDYNLIIFLVAHNTDDKMAPTREPKMMDIRDSGMIQREADTVLGIWRIPNDDDGTKGKMREPNENDIKAKVRIWKNRREGMLGWFLMQHENHYLYEIESLRNYVPNEEKPLIEF